MLKTRKAGAIPIWPHDWPFKGQLDRYSEPEEGSLVLGKTLVPDELSSEDVSLFTKIFNRDYNRPIALTPKERTGNLALVGPTGKGKSTKFLIPTLARDAVEGTFDKAPFNVVVDVKSPNLLSWIGPALEQKGRRIEILDPWTPNQSSRVEPLRQLSPEELGSIARNLLGQVCRKEGEDLTSPEGVGDDNIEDYEKAYRLLVELFQVVRLGKVSECSLPGAMRLLEMGTGAVVEHVSRIPHEDEAVEALIDGLEIGWDRIEKELLRRDEKRVVEVLDNAGPLALRLVEKGRDAIEARDIEKLREEVQGRRKQASAHKAFWVEISNEPDKNEEALKMARQALSLFKEPEIATMFSGPGINLQELYSMPGTLFIGAPLARLKKGAFGVASLLASLLVSTAMKRGEEDDHNIRPVNFFLDELSLLYLPGLPNWLAESQKHSLSFMLFYQERAQLKTLYGAMAPTIEANITEKVVLAGTHLETATWTAEAVGKDREHRLLMTPENVQSMRINGQSRTGLALSIGSSRPAYIFRPIPFYEDEEIIEKLGLVREHREEGRDLIHPPEWNYRPG